MSTFHAEKALALLERLTEAVEMMAAEMAKMAEIVDQIYPTTDAVRLMEEHLQAMKASQTPKPDSERYVVLDCGGTVCGTPIDGRGQVSVTVWNDLSAARASARACGGFVVVLEDYLSQWDPPRIEALPLEAAPSSGETP